MVKFIRQSWLVMAAALVFGLLVAGVFGALKPRIDENARLKLEREMKGLFGQDKIFEQVTDGKGTELYYVAIDPCNPVAAGYAFKAIGSGFADKISLLVAVDAQLEKLVGIAILKTNETPGFGDKIKDDEFKDQFKGSPLPKKGNKLAVVKVGDRGVKDEEIVTITGATISSEAVTKIVNDSVI